MEKEKLLKLLKSEPNDIDAIGMILSNYTDYGHTELGGMVSVKRFKIVAEVLLEWWDGKKADTSEGQSNSVGTSASVPAVRVKFYPTDTDETFDGTVIDEKPNFYVVIPDQNLQLTQNWNKSRCDVFR